MADLLLQRRLAQGRRLLHTLRVLERLRLCVCSSRRKCRRLLEPWKTLWSGSWKSSRLRGAGKGKGLAWLILLSTDSSCGPRNIPLAIR